MTASEQTNEAEHLVSKSYKDGLTTGKDSQNPWCELYRGNRLSALGNINEMRMPSKGCFEQVHLILPVPNFKATLVLSILFASFH